MDLLQAADNRISRRKYTGPVPAEAFARLQALAEKYSEEGGIEIRLCRNMESWFNGFKASYGLLSGVQDAFLLGGKAESIYHLEKLGYYGELLVLEAVSLGLGTCWVGGTYKQKELPENAPDSIDILITVGEVSARGLKERVLRGMIHRSGKSLKEMYTAPDTPLEWFFRGVECARKAPSAVNRQPVKFCYNKGKAFAEVPEMDGLYPIDLGIAKAHFALAAKGTWQWGNGGCFAPAE